MNGEGILMDIKNIHKNTCLWGVVNSKGADQPAQSNQHLCYLLIETYHMKTCYKQNFTILGRFWC